MATHPLAEVASLFLKLGTIAFGGPAAHIAMMEDEVVRRRQWITHQEFLDLLGAANLIPGPNSTEMAIFLGHRRAGWMGLLVAGVSFILPAAVSVTVIAWAYVRFGKLPQAEGLLYGIKPVIIAIVVQALWGLGRNAIKSPSLAALAVGCTILAFIGVHELLILLGTGLLTAFGAPLMRKRQMLHGLLPFLSLAAPAAPVPAAFSMTALFLFFLKVGSVLFGSGYVLLAFLRADLVERWHWLTESQLLDAIAVGQFTPGPVFTTATFIGYLLGNIQGAVVATVGIFLPAFIFVAVIGPFVPRLRASPVAGAVLDGVNVASLALMAVVTFRLGAAAVVDWPTIFLALISAVLLFRYRINSAWLVLGGAAVGWAMFSMGK